MTAIHCIDCDHPAGALDWRCTHCGGVLDFDALPPFDVDRIQPDDFSLWRYAAMLPVEKRISLGEGMTPLTRTTLGDDELLLKLDYLNPTGSYKDRGTVTMMNHLAAHDVITVVEDSSGNAGASVAAYSSALGIEANIYVPAHGSPSKKALIRAVGGTLVEIEGAQHAKTDAAQRAAEHTPYASHAWSPYFVLGQMTVAYEVWEQLGRNIPDIIVTPIGHGGLFLGFARGFAHLYEAGLISHLPHMVGIQSEHCDPIVRGWENGDTDPPAVNSSQTVADGIIVDVPVRGVEVLSRIRATNGAAFRVTDDAITNAQQRLMRHGFIAEPTSATTIAALPQIHNHFSSDPTILCALTGNGLKNIGR